MFYTVYMITNKLNGMKYIGKHKTDNLNDGYMGSGFRIKRAIAKYGIENFSKEFLFIFNSESEMELKEQELVDEDWVKRSDSYNIATGGQGGDILRRKNRKFEEIYGEAKADEIRAKVSNTIQSKPAQEKERIKFEQGKHLRGKSYEEAYGEEKAKALKEVRSKQHKGKVVSEETRRKLSANWERKRLAKLNTPQH